MDLDLPCVASWLVLLEEQHYGRAAARLHLTASALTKRVQRLEHQVGTKLVVVNRQGHAVATPAGRRFRRPAELLLVQAEEARRAALDGATVRMTLVLGVPAGPQGFVRRKLEPSLRELRETWPAVRVTLRPVPFPALTSCLVEHAVDMLWTVAPVRHPGVTSVPLGLSVARSGVVGPHHELVGRGSVPVEEFAALPMIYNPAVPDEWMSVFYLGDVRPRSEARLVTTDPSDTTAVAREGARSDSVLVTLAPLAQLVQGRLHVVELVGAPPATFHAAYRRDELRAPVHGLVDALVRNAVA